jgi:hypothetical protein
MGPKQKTILVGEELILPCDAIGTPTPSIAWTKDDISLELNQRIWVCLIKYFNNIFVHVSNFIIYYSNSIKV